MEKIKRDNESFNKTPDVPQNNLQLWNNIREAKECVMESLDYLLSHAPVEDVGPEDLTKLTDLQQMYNEAIDLAAAIEKVLIARQRETIAYSQVCSKKREIIWMNYEPPEKELNLFDFMEG